MDADKQAGNDLSPNARKSRGVAVQDVAYFEKDDKQDGSQWGMA